MTAEIDPKVIEFAASCRNDPLRWVVGAYPWGEPGELEEETGPHDWQRKVLEHIRDRLNGPVDESGSRVVRVAVASGHGIGKSALIGQLSDWGMSCRPFTRGVATANTESQLKTKTWGEVGKWRRLSITKGWFRQRAMSLFSPHPDEEQGWRIDLVPWSEQNPEATAGLHNKRRTIIIFYDEASAIANVIWESQEGALTDTDTDIIWICFGNPTRNTGRFKECFTSQSKFWFTMHVDARDVPNQANRAQIAEWLEIWGEDSDFFRVRVRGIFPNASSMQFIGEPLARGAMAREAFSVPGDPLVIGVDVARSGNNRSVLYPRRGRDARTIPPVILTDTRDSMKFASECVQYFERLKPDAVFVDGGGIGGPVCDRLRQLGWAVIEVQFGGSADEDHRYANKRVEMWCRLRDWLEVGAIPDEYVMIKDLCGLEADTDRLDRIRLEPKEHLIARGEMSTDIGDALALTLAYPVIASRVSPTSTFLNPVSVPHARAKTDWDMYGDE